MPIDPGLPYRTDAALSWVRRSIEVTGGRGSSHSYSPVFGWAKAYPETTGYLIETLLDYAVLKQDPSLEQLAFSCADWLCTLQLPNGAFPGLLAGHNKPSVFNTAQILFGLAAAHRRLTALGRPGSTYLLGLEHGVNWLNQVLEPDGAWRQAAYVPGFVPSYYTRAVWGVLNANEILQQADIQENMRRALYFYAGRFLPNGAVRDWGFRPAQAAFTHTIAYTLEGFLECAVALKEADILGKTIDSMNRLLHERERTGKTAGRYTQDWKGDTGFVCVSGNAQLSIVCRRLAQLTGASHFQAPADSLLLEVLGYQCLGNNRNTQGALPGSRPFWGPYMRFRYPNWGLKFFLDACKWSV